jgi:AcrR family transcriptional regulator
MAATQALRHPPTQGRSRARLDRVLEAAVAVLARDGAGAFTTTRIARQARLPIGAVYRFFADKHAIVEALAVRYWSELGAVLERVADQDARAPLADPVAIVLEVLAEGFRARPAFLALWYGLRSERLRDGTRPARARFEGSVRRILKVHWPDAPEPARATVAALLVLAGDGLLREAFRRSPEGDRELLAETGAMLDAYALARLGPRAR